MIYEYQGYRYDTETRSAEKMEVDDILQVPEKVTYEALMALQFRYYFHRVAEIEGYKTER